MDDAMRIGGRQPRGSALPDHGKQEYDDDYHGGNFAAPPGIEIGANGIILSRKYSEMRLDNRRAGRAVRKTVKAK